MISLFVSQRVKAETGYAETRDALDQRWADFLHACRLLPILVPNHEETARELIKAIPAGGILLTGGSASPRRDQAEAVLVAHAVAHSLPLLGVCHGMQVIQRYCGVPLEKVSGHVATDHRIRWNGREEIVNSYHEWGARESVRELEVLARSEDGVIKAVRHASLPFYGIMWHPERTNPFVQRDIDFFREWFGCAR
jgi:putative glutamine amidotransferase